MFSLIGVLKIRSKNYHLKWETNYLWVNYVKHDSPSGELGDGMTPPKKYYKHEVTDVFGIWQCKRCHGESRNIEKLQSIPCNAALVQKFMEIEAHIIYFLGL